MNAAFSAALDSVNLVKTSGWGSADSLANVVEGEPQFVPAELPD